MAYWFDKAERDAYRMYVGEILRLAYENTANFARGTYMTAKWSDVINPPKEDTRTPEEVIDHVKRQIKEVG